MQPENRKKKKKQAGIPGFACGEIKRTLEFLCDTEKKIWRKWKEIEK